MGINTFFSIRFRMMYGRRIELNNNTKYFCEISDILLINILKNVEIYGII